MIIELQCFLIISAFERLLCVYAADTANSRRIKLCPLCQSALNKSENVTKGTTKRSMSKTKTNLNFASTRRWKPLRLGRLIPYYRFPLCSKAISLRSSDRAGHVVQVTEFSTACMKPWPLPVIPHATGLCGAHRVVFCHFSRLRLLKWHKTLSQKRKF